MKIRDYIAVPLWVLAHKFELLALYIGSRYTARMFLDYHNIPWKKQPFERSIHNPIQDPIAELEALNKEMWLIEGTFDGWRAWAPPSFLKLVYNKTLLGLLAEVRKYKENNK